jgi:hypothetical protein
VGGLSALACVASLLACTAPPGPSPQPTEPHRTRHGVHPRERGILEKPRGHESRRPPAHAPRGHAAPPRAPRPLAAARRGACRAISRAAGGPLAREPLRETRGPAARLQGSSTPHRTNVEGRTVHVACSRRRVYSFKLLTHCAVRSDTVFTVTRAVAYRIGFLWLASCVVIRMAIRYIYIGV